MHLLNDGIEGHVWWLVQIPNITILYLLEYKSTAIVDVLQSEGGGGELKGWAPVRKVL